MSNKIMEINIDEFKKNVAKIKEYVGKEVTIMPIIKANGYGTYINQNLELIKDFNIVGVATVEEGIFVRELGFENEIFVLNQPIVEEIEDIISNNLIIGISSEEFVKSLNKYKQSIKVHLEIETGMGRTGINPKNIQKFLDNIGENIIIEGIYSHLSSADTDEDYTNRQIEIFNEVIQKVENRIGKIKYKHISNSNGVINFKESCFNLIRPGISIYGYESEEKMYEKINVIPIAKLKSKISFIKEVEEGTSISYSRNFIANKKMKIATVAIGYADGIRRCLSNIGCVVVNGKKAKIIGNVCMDSFMIDITNIKNVKEGDFVYIWDNELIKLEEVARQCNTINYEIISTISGRVKREFI